jgi:hypothetical protein
VLQRAEKRLKNGQKKRKQPECPQADERITKYGILVL